MCGDKRKGFTLVELLVVIAIIAMLLSVLMPALGKVRRQAREMVCLSNIRQLSTGLRMYADGNNGRMMRMYFSVSGTYQEAWFNYLGQYIGDSRSKDNPQGAKKGPAALMVCPTTKLPSNVGAAMPFTLWGSATMAWQLNQGKNTLGNDTYSQGSYGLNHWTTPDFPSMRAPLGPLGPAYDPYFYSIFSTIPSGVPVLCDAIWLGQFPMSNDSPAMYVGAGDQATSGMGRVCIDRHGMAINIGFADGHADKVKLEKLWSFKWNPQFIPTSVKTVRKRPTPPGW